MQVVLRIHIQVTGRHTQHFCNILTSKKCLLSFYMEIILKCSNKNPCTWCAPILLSNWQQVLRFRNWTQINTFNPPWKPCSWAMYHSTDFSQQTNSLWHNMPRNWAENDLRTLMECDYNHNVMTEEWLQAYNAVYMRNDFFCHSMLLSDLKPAGSKYFHTTGICLEDYMEWQYRGP